MKPAVIKYPVHDFQGRMLVDAGTELTPDFLEDFCSRSKEEHVNIPLLQYGSIHKDLMRQFRIAPYHVIFSDKEAADSVMRFMDQVRVPLQALQGMDYFRKNDFHTYRHMLMISALSTLIARNMQPEHIKLDREELAGTGPTHDIGKITVPLEILLKKKPLTHREFDVMRHHALAGYVLLCYYLQDSANLAARIARDHHELRDGSGYPRGIKQQNLIVEIVTVCDIYDALVAQRPYRPQSYDNRTALEQLTWMAQKGEIGWEAVKVLVMLNRHFKTAYQDVRVSLEHRGQEPSDNSYGKFADKGDNDHQNNDAPNITYQYR